MKKIFLLILFFMGISSIFADINTDFLSACKSNNINKVNEMITIIDKEVKKIVDEQYAEAKKLLEDNKDMLEYIAKTLLEKETLDEKEFEDLMNEVKSKRTFDNWQG